jgi:hypothetical protein
MGGDVFKRNRRMAHHAGLALLAASFMAVHQGCDRAEKRASLPANAVAAISGTPITAEAFQKELTRRTQSDSTSSLETRLAILHDLLVPEALYQRALAAGYDKDPQIQAALKRFIIAKYQEDQLAKLEPPVVSAADITNYYQSHASRFGSPERIHAAVIELKIARTASPEKRGQILQLASAILREAATAPAPDHTFGGLAQQHSEDQASRYQGGDIGWLTRTNAFASLPAAAQAALWKLATPGELAPVVETPSACYLIRLIERSPAAVRPLRELRDGIHYLVLQEKQQQRKDGLFSQFVQGLPIKTNLALLDSIQPQQNEATAPSGGPSQKAIAP